MLLLKKKELKLQLFDICRKVHNPEWSFKGWTITKVMGEQLSPSQAFFGCHETLPQKNGLLGERCVTSKKRLRERLARGAGRTQFKKNIRPRIIPRKT